jgi:hypothetical protein
MDEQKPYEFSAERAFAEAKKKWRAMGSPEWTTPELEERKFQNNLAEQREKRRKLYIHEINEGIQSYAKENWLVPPTTKARNPNEGFEVGITVSQRYVVCLDVSTSDLGGVTRVRMDGVRTAFDSPWHVGYAVSGLLYEKERRQGGVNGHTKEILKGLELKVNNPQRMR